ncbi:hypothetical protein F5141DRAFT_1063111 [Pisolithus sp. B1]|nr:hypothetical protein F5141DRAFT_1063111 [Pisolithus sp. B1]
MSLGETARKLWKDTIHEVLSQASAMIPGAPTVEFLSPTKGIKCLLMRVLTLFRADLASKAALFFMHEHNEEVEAAKNVHSTLLQMYALSAVALFYAIKHESKHVNKTLPHMPFMGMEFSPAFQAYYNSLLDAMQHAVLGARLKDRFDWLHCQGLLIDSITSTVGASGGGISNEQQPSSSMGWTMDFQGFRPTYYDYDL